MWADRGLDGQIVESVASLAIWCQFVCIIDGSSLPMSENGVTMGRMCLSVCDVCWSSRWLRSRVSAFSMFSMMKGSGYARANRMRVRLLSSSCRMWSSEMIML